VGLALRLRCQRDTMYLARRAGREFRVKVPNVIGVVMFFLLPTQLSAQESIAIRGVEVSIGMPRSTVLEKFRDYLVTCVADARVKAEETPEKCNSIMISPRLRPQDPYANIRFESGKARSIRKYWDRAFSGVEGRGVDKFVEALHAVISDYQSAGVAMRVHAGGVTEPGYLNRTVFITAGRKTVEISYVEGLQGNSGEVIPPFVNFTEVLE